MNWIRSKIIWWKVKVGHIVIQNEWLQCYSRCVISGVCHALKFRSKNLQIHRLRWNRRPEETCCWCNHAICHNLILNLFDFLAAFDLTQLKLTKKLKKVIFTNYLLNFLWDALQFNVIQSISFLLNESFAYQFFSSLKLYMKASAKSWQSFKQLSLVFHNFCEQSGALTCEGNCLPFTVNAFCLSFFFILVMICFYNNKKCFGYYCIGRLVSLTYIGFLHDFTFFAKTIREACFVAFLCFSSGNAEHVRSTCKQSHKFQFCTT